MSEWRARVHQDGMMVAQAFGNKRAVLAHGLHYLAVYQQDGPATMELHEKRKGRWRNRAWAETVKGNRL